MLKLQHEVRSGKNSSQIFINDHRKKYKMEFSGNQKTLNFIQINAGPIEDVFPLLCPVREKDWLDGWEYRMIYSVSGLIEKDCVFSTPHHGKFDTIWHVTQYNKANHLIEFLRVTPSENVVKINIQLEKIDAQQTRASISYQYTALSEDQNKYIENELEGAFQESMLWWEKSINHYLKTGEMLKKDK
jgi:hypothetical protein